MSKDIIPHQFCPSDSNYREYSGKERPRIAFLVLRRPITVLSYPWIIRFYHEKGTQQYVDTTHVSVSSLEPNVQIRTTLLRWLSVVCLETSKGVFSNLQQSSNTRNMVIKQQLYHGEKWKPGKSKRLILWGTRSTLQNQLCIFVGNGNMVIVSPLSCSKQTKNNNITTNKGP